MNQQALSDAIAKQAPAQPILLWLTDRSRYETGNKCPRNRLLEYHWGPHGYGIRKSATKIPLATGDVIHRGLGHVLVWCQQNDTTPPPLVLDTSVQMALDAYQEIIDTRGLLHWHEDQGQQDRLVEEQKLLIEGLIRAWTLWRLPEVLRDWQIVHVEEEHLSVFDCTCGIGDRLGTLEDHVAKGCEGIGVQTRADFVALHRASGTYSYHEFKTTAENNARFREEYETTMQPYLGTIGIEDALGIEITQIFVHGLIKGSYDKEYNPATKLYDGPEYQNSRLVYAWKNEATAVNHEWAVRYAWTDPTGVGHKLPRSFKRAYVSEFGPYKEYLETFGEDLRPQVLHTIGPLLRKDHVRTGALESWVHEERRIRWALHHLADLIDAHAGDWATEPVQRFLDREFKRTFDCQRFGGRYKCHMIPICHEHPGWEDPMGLLGYVQRRPHHLPEEWQAVQRGLLPPLQAVDTTDQF